jgi:hypothetical protein
MIANGFISRPKEEVEASSLFGVSQIILSSFLSRVRVLLGFI